jgi:nucleoside-diphosphate-sugar epimerase
VKRLFHVSTPSLYFYYDERRNVKESDPLPKKFVNHYAKTKYIAELEIDKAFHEGLPTITIRPRAIFGPGDNAILPRLIKVCEKGMFPKIGKGYVEVDITYVENVVDALMLCLTSGEETLGKKYNITNGVRVNLYEMLEDVMGQLGKTVTYKEISYNKAFFIAMTLEYISTIFLGGREPLLTRYTVSVLSQSQTLSLEKAQQELGYIPAVSIEQGTKEFVEWWKKHEN